MLASSLHQAQTSRTRPCGAQRQQRLSRPARAVGRHVGGAARHPSTPHSSLLLQQASTSGCPEALWGQWAQSVAAPVVTTASPASAGSLVRNRVVKNKKGLFRIRHLQESDLLPVAQLQAASFYESMPVKALDQMAFTMFKAEVLSAVQKKTKVLADNGFAILVVESCSTAANSWSDTSSSSSGSSSSDLRSDWVAAVWYGDQQATAGRHSSSQASGDESASSSGRSNILGVIEVGVQDEQDVLQHMPRGMETYAYISSMAVASNVRRCGIGAALLQAAEQQAALWGQQLLALHVYETNDRAIKLYESHGLVNHAADPAWRKYIGGKVRQLMIKWL